MNEKVRSFLKEIEKTMVCIAYAEAGEACPIDNVLNEKKETARCIKSLQGTMTCSTYAEAGVSCPICEGA